MKFRAPLISQSARVTGETCLLVNEMWKTPSLLDCVCNLDTCVNQAQTEQRAGHLPKQPGRQHVFHDSNDWGLSFLSR